MKNIKSKMTKVGVTNQLINGGLNKTRANKFVNKNYAYVKRVYGGQGITNKKGAEIVLSLGLHDNY